MLGGIGWAMRSYGFPIAPAIVGLILGPIAEEQLRRTLAISQGDATALVTSPFAAVVYVLVVLALVGSQWLKRRQARLDADVLAEAQREDDLVAAATKPHAPEQLDRPHRNDFDSGGTW